MAEMITPWATEYLSNAFRGRENTTAPAERRLGIGVLGRAVMTLTAVFAAGCATPGTAVRMTFEMHSSHPDAGLSFFVSSMVLVSGGSAVPVRFDAAGPWQDDATALVAFAGPENHTVTGRAAKDEYDAVEFLLGVPFERNHGNPLAAAPPLNVPSMFWTWQSGYKFLRVDLGNEWSFHLGSTGCMSASAVRPPAKACRQPNLARIRLPVEAAYGGIVLVDLDALHGDVDTGEGNCMEAFADRPGCRRLLARLGLDADTGACTEGCSGQRVFRLGNVE